MWQPLDLAAVRVSGPLAAPIALALLGRVPGGLGVATVGACTLIGAISGASTATVAVVGKSLYPGLLRDGYGKRFSAGLVHPSRSLNNVIPPRNALIP